MMNKPTIPDIVPLIKRYVQRDGNAVGGDYHIVLDECNIQDGHVEMCLDWARKKNDTLGIEIGEMLLKMSKTQRSKLAGNIWDDIAYPNE